jgi:hypothetical protein
VVNFKEVRSPDGRFELPANKRTRETTLLVRADGFAAGIHKVRTVLGAIVDVGDIVLRTGRKLTGVVRDQGGLPVAGASVRVGEDRMAPVEAVKTSGSGAFVLARVPSERTTLLVEDERYLRSEIPVLPAQQNLDVTLTRGARIFGSFGGASGGPLPGVAVMATSLNRETRSIVDSNGKFEISGLGSGSWLVQSYIPGMSNPWSDWRIVKLKRNGTVELKLSEPARGTELRVILESGGRNGHLTLVPGKPQTPKTYSEMRAVGPMFFGNDAGGTLRSVQPG